MIFEMYNSYGTNDDFNRFLKDNYLVKDDLYSEQNKTATCPVKPPPGTPATAITIQAQQTFVASYINQETPFRGLLLWHGLGSGKSCSAIQISNRFPNKEKTIIVPAALVKNFQNDYPKCGDQKTIFNQGKTSTKITHGPAGTSERITAKTDISDVPLYSKFMVFTSNGNANTYSQRDPPIFEDRLIIIDESQLLIERISNALFKRAGLQTVIDRCNAILADPTITPEAKIACEATIGKNTRLLVENRHFVDLYEDLRRVEKSRIVCLSGTPISSNPIELAIVFNIIHGDIVYWNIAGFANVNAFIAAIADPRDKEIIENNIDLKRSIFSLTSCTLFKHPYDFINSSGGIQYNPSLTCIHDVFENALRQFSPVRTTTLLFDTTNPNVMTTTTPAEFKHKITGLSSYFGNIQKLLPTVTLTDNVTELFRTNPNLYKYGIGRSNNSTDLYEIKYLNMSPLSVEVQQFERVLPDAYIIKKIAKAARFFSNTEQFVYPGLVEWFTKYRSVTTTVPQRPRIEQTDEEKKQSNERRAEISHSPNMKELLKQARDKLDKRAAEATAFTKAFQVPAPVEMNPYMNEQTLKEMTDREKEAATFAKDLRMRKALDGPLPLSGIGSVDTYSNTEPFLEATQMVKNIWNKTDFLKLRSEFDVRDPGCKLMNYSPKMFDIINCIMQNPDEIHLIYSEYLQVNIPLIRALQANGFEEYRDESDVAISTIPDGNRYMFYTGTSETTASEKEESVAFSRFLLDSYEGKASDRRDDLLDKFNSGVNSTGQKVRVIIINSAAAEGITIKNVRYVHLLHIPPNMSKLFQIIGRAIRNCTHEALPESKRTVKPILYLSIVDEPKYTNIIDTNAMIVPYLNTVKEATIDCLFNKKIVPTQECFIDGTGTSTSHTPWIGYTTVERPKGSLSAMTSAASTPPSTPPPLRRSSRRMPGGYRTRKHARKTHKVGNKHKNTRKNIRRTRRTI
jgi:hypothetical protein